MSKPIFNLGLTMAGAISVGAYTAGVIDFLLEALKEWEKEKEKYPDKYPYDVKINAISGASAGGMTAAIMTALLGSKFESTKNTLHTSWVEDIDIEHLLGNRDIEKSKQIASLLDSSVLDEITERALNIKPDRDEWPSYISENLHILISVANLRGVPYHLEFKGEKEDKASAMRQHGMLMHEDFMHFIFSENDPKCAKEPFAESAIWLDANDYTKKDWDLFGETALASGAFPLGLAPRQLSRKLENYNNRKWLINLDCINCSDPNGQVKGYKYSKIEPSWPTGMPLDYDFNCVDGGLMNNEPFEWLSSYLSDEECTTENDYPNSALLMIDPFPQSDPLDLKKNIGALDIFGVFSEMFSALKNQARFKLEEIKRTSLNKAQERFLISPTRTDAIKSPIAGGSLDGFGGFLSRDFREHDFILGRRNCQYFLKHHFTLSAHHPLFEKIKETDSEELPIIPLHGSAAIKIKRPDWPEYNEDKLYCLSEMITSRMENIVSVLIKDFVKGFWATCFAKIFFWKNKIKMTIFVVNKIQKNLQENGLMK
jgi:predicted acylesterase/phospholipase RssA